MPLDLTDDKSTLVQVMAWCRQATSHYLSQCWPRSVSPNGVTRPQWVKLTGDTHIDLCGIFLWVLLWDNSGYRLSQWDTTLHCNIVFHWLSPCPEWSLLLRKISMKYEVPTVLYWHNMGQVPSSQWGQCWYRADSRFVPSQWETSVQSNAISHWLGANLESALWYHEDYWQSCQVALHISRTGTLRNIQGNVDKYILVFGDWPLWRAWVVAVSPQIKLGRLGWLIRMKILWIVSSHIICLIICPHELILR